MKIPKKIQRYFDTAWASYSTPKIAKKSCLVVSNDTGPGHIAALSKTNTLFLALDNIISKSNLSEYKNVFKILGKSMNIILVEDVLKYLDENKLINK